MNKIRAKFEIKDVDATPASDTEEGSEVVFAEPVVSSEGENSDFSKYTPSGELRLYITNPAAFGFFEVGKEYYLDFTPAGK